MDFGAVGEPTAGFVDNQRIIFPGVPVAEHDFHELVRAVVAQVVLHNLTAAHVERLAVVERGHHVPARPTVGH